MLGNMINLARNQMKVEQEPFKILGKMINVARNQMIV